MVGDLSGFGVAYLNKKHICFLENMLEGLVVDVGAHFNNHCDKVVLDSVFLVFWENLPSHLLQKLDSMMLF